MARSDPSRPGLIPRKSGAVISQSARISRIASQVGHERRLNNLAIIDLVDHQPWIEHQRMGIMTSWSGAMPRRSDRPLTPVETQLLLLPGS